MSRKRWFSPVAKTYEFWPGACPELLKIDHLCHSIGELFTVTFKCEELVLSDRPPAATKVEVAILVFIIVVSSKIESAVLG